ncbi:hypothetical protein AA637_04095 [Cyanobacterium sp. HL-69]|nr:hypothetical protein AA637_04095 [Cyanobacterium sp. HL-69]
MGDEKETRLNPKQGQTIYPHTHILLIKPCSLKVEAFNSNQATPKATNIHDIF